MSEYLNTIIGYQVGSTAEWRRVKAEQFPDDRRNVRAAEELEELAAQIDRIGEAEPIHQQIAKLDDTLNAMDNCDDAWLHITEAVSEELRSIGFHSSYETGLQFLEWYRDIVQEQIDELLDEAEPVSNPDEPDDRARIRAAALEEALAACKTLAERITIEHGKDNWESGCNACTAAVLALLGRAER
jgi:hypothetical protein